MHNILHALGGLLEWVTAHIDDLAWLAGLASVAAGIAMIYVPAGVIAAGMGLCFMGFALGSGSSGDTG